VEFRIVTFEVLKTSKVFDIFHEKSIWYFQHLTRIFDSHLTKEQVLVFGFWNFNFGA